MILLPIYVKIIVVAGRWRTGITWLLSTEHYWIGWGSLKTKKATFVAVGMYSIIPLFHWPFDKAMVFGLGGVVYNGLQDPRAC